MLAGLSGGPRLLLCPTSQVFPRPLCHRVRLVLLAPCAASWSARGAMSWRHCDAGADWYPHGMSSLAGGHMMSHTLTRLGSKFEVSPMPKSAFVKPYSITYEMDGARAGLGSGLETNGAWIHGAGAGACHLPAPLMRPPGPASSGQDRRWDAVEAHASVAGVLYHTSRRAALLVRQFRPAVFAAARREAALAGTPAPCLAAGFTYELCAGIADKHGLGVQEVMVEEMAEEAGFAVAPSDLIRVTSIITALGVSGARQTIFAAAVDDAQETGSRGGLARDGEAIEVLALPVERIPDFLDDERIAKSAGAMYALLWLRDRLAENGGNLAPVVAHMPSA